MILNLEVSLYPHRFFGGDFFVFEGVWIKRNLSLAEIVSINKLSLRFLENLMGPRVVSIFVVLVFLGLSRVYLEGDHALQLPNRCLA